MKKLCLVLSLALAFGLVGGIGQADAQPGLIPANDLNETGSLLVFPLLDNINFITLINIANTGSMSAVLEGYCVTHGDLDTEIDEKSSFIIKLSPKEKFLWNTAQPRNTVNAEGDLVQIQSFNNRKGYCFVWAVNNDIDQDEIDYDSLKGDATLIDLTFIKAFNYNAIPHQGLLVVGDRVLNLDDLEYTAATSQIMFEGITERPGIEGTLAVANIGVDFKLSKQKEFNIEAFCWNEDEVKVNRHLHFKDFAQYDFGDDLQLTKTKVFTDGFHCSTSSVDAIWAVFYQTAANGMMGWGGNVFQNPNTSVAVQVILPAVPTIQ